MQNQFGVIIHELIHAYLYEALNPSDPDREIYPLNETITLSKVSQYWNANNHAYYAACVYSGCQSFPTGFQTGPPSSKKLRRQTAGAETILTAILDNYPYHIGLDTAALSANLTALGYLV